VRLLNLCSVYVTMLFVCIVELHGTVNYMKMFCVAQQCSPATIKSTQVFM